MTDDSSDDHRRTEFLLNVAVLPPDTQDFVQRLLAGLVARVKSDPEASRMPPVDLLREVTLEIAPDRPDYLAVMEGMGADNAA